MRLPRFLVGDLAAVRSHDGASSNGPAGTIKTLLTTMTCRWSGRTDPDQTQRFSLRKCLKTSRLLDVAGHCRRGHWCQEDSYCAPKLMISYANRHNEIADTNTNTNVACGEVWISADWAGPNEFTEIRWIVHQSINGVDIGAEVEVGPRRPKGAPPGHCRDIPRDQQADVHSATELESESDAKLTLDTSSERATLHD